ncbi:MAG: hypothetical protein IM613_17155, partial [Cytophagales bacterium]|nr:hypothetical protein [Cytophagales bacterium]
IMATKLDLADAQFIGFFHGKEGRIVDMVEAMGLTKAEWKKWKSKYPNVYLKDSEIKEIDHHFGISDFGEIDAVK